MASVPPVEAPIASTVPGGSAVAVRRAGCGRFGLGRGADGFRTAYARSGGGANLLREVVPQLSHRVRTAGLGQNLDRAEFQRLYGGAARGLREAADDDGGQRMEVHQLLQKGQAIHARHFDVQREHIGAQREDLVARHVGVGRGADHLDVALAGQSFGEDSAHNGRIVNDQDAYFSVAGHVRVSIRIAAVSVPLPVSTV